MRYDEIVLRVLEISALALTLQVSIRLRMCVKELMEICKQERGELK